MSKYDPAKRLAPEKFPRFPKSEWLPMEGKATLLCGCGGTSFRVQKVKMDRTSHSKKAHDRKVVAVCLNPKCGQQIKLR